MSKTHCSYMIEQEVTEKLEQHYKDDGSKTKSKFVERAINFYCGYVTAENCRDFFPKVILSSIKGTFDSFEARMASLLFELAVEVSVLNRVTAAMVDTSELNLPRIRADCVIKVDAIDVREHISFKLYRNGSLYSSKTLSGEDDMTLYSSSLFFSLALCQ